MLKALKWAGIGLAALLVVVGVPWTISRLSGPTQEQARALEVLAQRDVAEGRNAFPAIWLLPYDVPEEQLEAVTAEDAKRFAEAPLPSAGGDPAAMMPVSVAEGRFPRFGGGNDALRCQPGRDDCLAKVRAQPVAYAKWRKDNAPSIARVEALSGYGHYRSTFVPRVDMPFPAFSPLFSPLTARAVDFVEGRADLAVDGVCRDIDMYRKLSKAADSLVASMVALAGVRGGSILLAQMLAELPADFPLPQSCAAAATVPSLEEVGLCNAMRGEAAYARGVAAAVQETGELSGNRLANLFSPLLFDNEGMQAMNAPMYAWACSQEAEREIAEDRPLRIPARPAPWIRFECIGNAAGCLLGDIAAPAFDGYLRRGQDSGAQLKLLGTLLWLRGHADDTRPLHQRLASRPGEFKSSTRDIEIVGDGKALSIRMFDNGRGESFELPLPPYLQDAAQP